MELFQFPAAGSELRGNKRDRSAGRVLHPNSEPIMTNETPDHLSRRSALKCMAHGAAGTLFVLAGGTFTPVDCARAADDKQRLAALGKPLFLQMSDTHIGFAKD